MEQQVEFNKVYLKEEGSAEFIEITEKYNTESEYQLCDPLACSGDEVYSPRYYRIDHVVFTEPINNGAPVIKIENDKDASTIILSENVSITKKLGKGKNLFVHLQDQSNLHCPVPNCSKSFITPTLLRTHIRKVHYSDKKYTCEVCGATFTAQYLLKRHSAVHKGIRVQCPICKKMLSMRTNLSQHIRSHAGTRRHECLVCGKRFCRSSTLKVHQRNAHKDAA